MSDPQPVLWLTSRSAYERGTQFCPMARYLEYHAGPYGYGFTRRATSMPLTTGSYTHLGCTEIAQWILEARLNTGVQPDEAPDEVIRWAANLAVERYQEVVRKRGILTIAKDNPEQLANFNRIVAEQSALIEGLIWTWALYRLPQILQEYLIVAIEEEEEYVIGCTCGLGSGLGAFSDHALRACGGIGLQSKPDLLLERRIDHAYCYTELKTSSTAKRSWSDSYERKQQLILGVLGAEKRHGVEITHARIEGLIKGQRKKDYPFTEEMPKTQQNSLCYGYFEPPVPPLSVGDWKPAHTYYDRDGVKHTVPKGKNNHYRRTGIWEQPKEIAFPGCPEGMSVSEYWVRYLASEYPHHLGKSLHAIGPIPKNRAQLDKALRGFEAEERLWQDRLWKIYDFQQSPAGSGKGFGDPEFMAFVETVIPRSWNCDPYGPDHPCQFQPICHEQIAGWRQPVESELYIYRTPHHAAEAAQMEARGLKPEFGLGEDEDPAEDSGDWGE